MTNEELVALIQAGVDVQENMAQLYQQNRRFITKIALPYSNTCELEDLVQEAYFGLEKAAKKFEPDRGFKFLTYAENWIRQVIHRYCQNNGNLKRVPVHVLEQISKYQKFRNDFIGVVGVEPTDEDYCGYLEISAKELKELRTHMVGSDVKSFSETVPGVDDATLADTLADDFNLEESVIGSIADEEAKAIIWGAVSDLKDREATIVRGYYRDGETLDDLADRLSISREKVRQLKFDAINTLRRCNNLKRLAEMFGYNCQQAYTWGLGRWRNTGTSSTEFLALKHIELQESKKEVTQQTAGLSKFTTTSAERVKKDSGHVPIGMQRLSKKLEEIDSMLDELNALSIYRNSTGKEVNQ